MKVIKLYRKPNQPEYFKLVRVNGREMLLDYPIGLPDSKRMCRWLNLDDVYVDWVKEFQDELGESND